MAALSTIAKTWKPPKCPLTDIWIRKLWCIYTMEYYSATKKNDIMPFAATWMELETLILSEVSQEEKDKYHMISHIWNLKYGTNESFHRKETHGLVEQICDCQGRRGRSGMDWESGVNGCKLLRLEWISNEILLNRGNDI